MGASAEHDPTADSDVAPEAEAATDADAATPDDEEESDGRLLRRLRNMQAVREAILDLFAVGEPVTLAAVARRAGVAGRSIYRYFGDLDAAVADAQHVRLAEIFALFDAQGTIDRSLPLDERLDELLDHRFELERLGRPLRFTRQQVNPDDRFDAQVIDAFAPELESLDEDRARQIGSVIAWALRPRAIRSHLDSGQDEQWTRDTVRFSVLAALAQSHLHTD